MILFHGLLKLFIFMTSIYLLLSYNAYGVYTNGEITLNDSNIDYNTSLSATSHTQDEECVYSWINVPLINKLLMPTTQRQKLVKLHSFVLKAIEHQVSCRSAHNLDSVISIIKAADACDDSDSIDWLAGQLIDGEITGVNDTWDGCQIWSMSITLSMHIGSNINRLREMMASKIMSQDHDLQKWKSFHFTHALYSLARGESNTEKEALQKIISYLATKECHVDEWDHFQLSLLFNLLTDIDGEEVQIVMDKVCDIITNSNFSCCHLASTLSLFKPFVKLQRGTPTNTNRLELYRNILTTFINYLVSDNIDFRGCSGKEIAAIIGTLRSITKSKSKSSWRYNVVNLRRKLTSVIANGNISTSSMNSNDWMMLAYLLETTPDINKKAISTLLFKFNTTQIDLSSWQSNELLGMIALFSKKNEKDTEEAMQKIARFISTANLDSWSMDNLQKLTRRLGTKSRDFQHNPTGNIALHMLSKPKYWFTGTYAHLAWYLSRGQNHYCRELMKSISDQISNDSFDLSNYSPSVLASLLSILSNVNGESVEKALNKIAGFFIDNGVEQLLYLPSEPLKRILDGFNRHYRLKNIACVIRSIAHIITDEKKDLSSWPVATLALLLRHFDSTHDDIIIQNTLRKVAAVLYHPSTELQSLRSYTIACLAEGISHLRDYSSEKLLTLLMAAYIDKEDYSESRCGVKILMAACSLPLEADETIKTAIKLASVVSDPPYSYMSTIHRPSLFWAITLFDFVAHEKGREVCTDTQTEDRLINLTKMIPIIGKNEMHEYEPLLSNWQIEFINIMNPDYTCKSKGLSFFEHDDKSRSALEQNIHTLIEKEFTALNIHNHHSNQSLVNVCAESESKSLTIKIKEPTHFFKDDKNRIYRRAQDRFIDFILEKKLGYKVMRIDYDEAVDPECENDFIQDIKDFFPNQTHDQ
ncbi:MAG: hypothetical protein QS721_11280 [Candidatus Endonucleobacter sp. (ex Gigantidas childressi)]|nr:hypothetical protein [Candidatus Endonucleobacter sp. (ex Gigantidas childressi)]